MDAQLDVWSIDIRAAACPARRLGDLLDDSERERATRFVRPADALRYRIAHGALRTILGGATGIAPRQVRFAQGDYGKPQLADGGPRFSLSHSGALAVVAVCADRDVGVDVEAPRPVPAAAALARRFFSPAAAAAIAVQSPGLRDQRFLREWTAMEAILKGEGTGLAEGLDGFEVHDAGGDRGVASATAWSLRWLALPRRHVGAVAARGGDFALRMRHFA